jgi:hypothetical protein
VTDPFEVLYLQPGSPEEAADLATREAALRLDVKFMAYAWMDARSLDGPAEQNLDTVVRLGAQEWQRRARATAARELMAHLASGLAVILRAGDPHAPSALYGYAESAEAAGDTALETATRARADRWLATAAKDA